MVARNQKNTHLDHLLYVLNVEKLLFRNARHVCSKLSPQPGCEPSKHGSARNAIYMFMILMVDKACQASVTSVCDVTSRTHRDTCFFFFFLFSGHGRRGGRDDPHGGQRRGWAGKGSFKFSNVFASTVTGNLAVYNVSTSISFIVVMVIPPAAMNNRHGKTT